MSLRKIASVLAADGVEVSVPTLQRLLSRG
jgi:hypothetical protein